MAPDERRAAIIASTVPLLRDRGRAVSTKEIARAAGVAEGTIFRVFESKDELVSACIHDAFETEALRAELVQIDPTLPLRERLAVAVSTMQDYLLGIFSLMAVLQATGQQVHRPHQGQDPRREQANAAIDTAFTELIGSDADQLRLPPRDVVNYLRMITLSSVHPMLDHHGSSAQELVDVILEGALVRPGPVRPQDSGPSTGKGAARATKGEK
jgi:AcrR family transcriptional regulator